MSFRSITYERLLQVQINRFKSFSGLLKYSLDYQLKSSQKEYFERAYDTIDEIKEKTKQIFINKDNNGDKDIEIYLIPSSSWGLYLVYNKSTKQLLIEYSTGARPSLLFDVNIAAVNQSLAAPSWGKFYLDGGYRSMNGFKNSLELENIPNIGWKQMVDILSGKMSFDEAIYRISRTYNPAVTIRRKYKSGKRNFMGDRQIEKNFTSKTKSFTKKAIKTPYK